MALPHNKYFIQDKLKANAPHHQSFKQLWETKWKMPAQMGVYPFMFGCARDFEPIVTEMEKKEMKEPYNWDAYAEQFFPQAEKLEEAARTAEANNEQEKASELYLRASVVYRIARFPAPRSEKQRYAWKKNKECCIKGLGMRERPTQEVMIPHVHGIQGEGAEIPVYFHVPATATTSSPAPLVIIYCGLDGYRTELSTWIEGFSRNGVAVLVLEIPGTGDSPAMSNDPLSPDRQNSSLLDWVDGQSKVDSKRVVVWGFSTGGYYAIRIAHTHKDRVAGSISLGGGCHYMFDKPWLDEVNHLEYPFDLANTLAFKWGYGEDVEKFKKEGSSKFSLLHDGTLDRPCTRLLLVNGTEDEIFPIDDMYVSMLRGDPKEARFVSNKKHMGEPESFFIILKWIYKVFDIEAEPARQLALLPFQPKY